MLNHQLNNKINQKLQEFEEMEAIMPSSDWNSLLMSRLEKSKPSNSGSMINESYKIVVLLLLVINIGFVVNVLRNSSTTDLASRNTELQKVSSELLINPIVSSN